MVDYQTISIVLTGIGIIVAIVYYAQVLRNAEKSRQREMVYQKYQSHSLEYTRAYSEVSSFTDWDSGEEFHEKYGALANPDAWSKYLMIERSYNAVGILLQENMVSADIIFKLYPAHSIIRMWEQFLHLTEYARDRYNAPDHLESFEFLYNEAKKRYPDITAQSPPKFT